MTAPSVRYDLEVRARRTPRFAIGFAVFLIAVFVVVGLLLRRADTGVYFQTSDQVAMILLGFLLAGAVLLLTRPRLRVNASGALVRNVLTEKLVEWDLIEGLSFPDGASWARIELPDDEFIAVMAISANDRGRAVDAVQRFRELHEKYAPTR